MKEIVQDRSDGINTNDLHVRVLLFQIAADARDGPACSHPRYETGYAPFAIVPDFRPRRGKVCGGIGRVVVLIGVEGVRNFPCELFGYGGITPGLVGGTAGRQTMNLGALAFSR